MNSTLARGVLYDKADHAGCFRRLVATIIDITLLLMVGLTLSIFWIIVSPAKQFPPAFFLVWLTIAYLYLVPPKLTNVGTLGFIVADLKIVNLAGNRPSLWTMTSKFFLLLGMVLLSPLYILLDLLWLIDDPNGQTGLDKAVGTYVVRRQAMPAASGVQHVVIYHLLGFSLLFREVRLARQLIPDLTQPDEPPDVAQSELSARRYVA